MAPLRVWARIAGMRGGWEASTAVSEWPRYDRVCGVSSWVFAIMFLGVRWLGADS